MKLLEILLYLAATAHLGILLAGSLVPKALDWKHHFRELPKLLRQLFWVYGVFIMLVVMSFSILTFVHAEAMVAGDAVARSLCAMIAVFWGLRLMVQIFVFDTKPFLVNGWYRFGDHMLTLTFIFLTGVYGAAAIVTRP